MLAEPASSSAAEWLLDNAHQVQRAILQVKHDLPAGFYRRLKPIVGGLADQEPLVLAIAHDLLHATRYQLSSEAVLSYLEGYQEHDPLDIAELWALPAMLRLACLERLIDGFELVFPSVPAPLEVSACCRSCPLAADPSEAVSRAIANLHVIASIAWKDIFDAASHVERTLARDPSATYLTMDFETRDAYRRAVERLSRRFAIAEVGVARQAVELAEASETLPNRHVGYWLVGQGASGLEQALGIRPPLTVRLGRALMQRPGEVYVLALFLLGLAGLVLPAFYLALSKATPLQWLLGLALSALPATVISVTLVNWLVTLAVAPRRLAKLDFAKRIDPAWPTLVAMPVIVGSVDEVPELIARLESQRLANPGATHFVLLSDPADADREHIEADEVIESGLREGIEHLNRRYGRNKSNGPFCLLHRVRQFNAAQDCWMAWERKRGKLEQFNRFLLNGDATAFPVNAGPVTALPGTRLVVTADADTRLPPGSVARLAGTLAHPLNRPVFDEQGRVVAGYTVLQPRVEIAPHGSDSVFARLFGGDTAIDIYSRAVSDVYQDLVGTGNFVGKGIYDVAAFTRSLEGRVPENNLLSHDLWEGLHGRAGLVSDIIVYESFPESYGEYAQRWHRWVRGDWQLLPWLLPRVPGASGKRLNNRLSLFDRLRIWDNMRRSLVPASVLLLLLGGWFVLPGHPLVWTLLALLAPGAWLFTDLVTGVARGRRRGVLTGTLHEIGDHLGRWALQLVFLVSDTATALHAVSVTLLRMLRGKQLLEWISAAHVNRRLAAANPRIAHWRGMWVSPVTAVLLLPALASHPRAFGVAMPLVLLWLAAPEIAWLTGRARERRTEPLDEAQRAYLRQIARRSWLFFESCVRPEDNWLPPDNHQEEPVETTAHRTSPTNIGMMAISALSACRFGHIGANELCERMHSMLGALDRLERWCGHFLNWYDTTALTPLEPRYVSTVDSGNLAVSLLTLAKACEEIACEPAFDAGRWQGFDDCLALLADAIAQADPTDRSLAGRTVAAMRAQAAAVQAAPLAWPEALARGQSSFHAVRGELALLLNRSSSPSAPSGTLRELHNWLERSEHHLVSMHRDLASLLPWLDRLAAPPPGCETAAAMFADLLDPACRLDECADLAYRAEELRQSLEPNARSGDAVTWLGMVAVDIRRGLARWRRLGRRLTGIAQRSIAVADEMDFAPLYDRNERLFNIGYDTGAERIDQHHYDLLASEARLASLFAIAKHDVPAEHWFQLGRPIVKHRGELALVSWNGSMFEYLMPTLFLRSDPSTLLGESDRSAVAMQRRYGRTQGVPWGISESGFASVGADGTWRYRAFGVPELGLRRGLAEDLVVAPYATALALAVSPREAVSNLREIASLGAVGRYGFFEALDFTPSRLGGGPAPMLVRSYMAHHHGMTIAAIANALLDDALVRWFHADPRIQTVDLLLNERIPWELPPEIERFDQPAGVPGAEIGIPRPQPWEPPDEPVPAIHALGNGRLASRIAADGSGELAWREHAVTRPGMASQGSGVFFYLRDTESGQTWSPTMAPLGGMEEKRTILHAHKAEFRCQANGLSTTLDVLVAPAEDVEIRRLRLVNSTDSMRRLELASHAEIALAPMAEWLRHPAFARLFVAAEVHPDIDALLFERRAREPGATAPAMVQRFISGSEHVRLTGWEVSRRETRARLGSARDFPNFSGPHGPRAQYPLDPAAAFRAEIDVMPHGEVEIALVTCVAASRAEALELARRYGSLGSLDWAEQDASERAARDLHGIGLPPERLADAQMALSALLRTSGPRGKGRTDLRRDDLWAMGISGDLPILLMELGEDFDAAELRFILALHRFWRWRGALVDLVLLHGGLPGYIEPVLTRVHDLLKLAGSEDLLAARGGVHLLAGQQLDERRGAALHAAAALRLDDRGGTIAEQIAAQQQPAIESPLFVPPGRPAGLRTDVGDAGASIRATSASRLDFENGLGGFTAQGEYRIELSAQARTPAPWANVLANPGFGTIVTEAGLGWTYAANSGENRITPWHNDPQLDVQSEALYLRDEETGEIWSVTPLPAGGPGNCTIEHRRGETSWMRTCCALRQDQQCFVAVADPVKIVRLTLKDFSGSARRITATFFADWLLGAVADEPGPFRNCRFRPDLRAVFARNAWQAEFTGRTAFVTATLPLHSLTTSRHEFAGAPPDLRLPPGLAAWDLGDRTENFGADAAAALQVHLDIPAGGQVDFAFVLGQAEDEATAAELAGRWQELSRIDAERLRVSDTWHRLCGAVEVTTPDRGFDLMVSNWLPYQAISSRVFARAGFYQAGGAFGFRDQLQDVLALILADPDLARAQILRAAAHQFAAGDVLHWWHPPTGRGVRTRCSDDLIWLPFVVAHYVDATGDSAVLDERAAFLDATELRDDEHDRYSEFPSDGEASIYEHCLRAFERAWKLGVHDLPLIGAGDWNDGLDRLGVAGKGESVWLGWFLVTTVRNFAAMCKQAGRGTQFGKRWLPRANELLAAIERHAWGGDWYMRAFDDLGRPLGSKNSVDCKIDSLAQSWAAIAGGNPVRARTALDSAFAELVRDSDDIVRLLDPPFGEAGRDPGYIKAYPPGIRENGGQYSHAAAWLGIAAAMLGDGDRAKEVFDRISPIRHSASPEASERYAIEPYVVAGDIGGCVPHLGRGGWSWYTGAAAWTWRLATEHILGIRLEAGRLVIAPCLPSDWPGYSATVRGAGEISITVRRGSRPGLVIDGHPTESGAVDFPGQGQAILVEVTIPQTAELVPATEASPGTNPVG